MKNVFLLNNPAIEYRPESSVPASTEAVARRIANVLGAEYGSEEIGDTYYVPFSAIHQPLAEQKSLTGEGDVYGGIVKEPQHADKAILHELPRSNAIYPAWYSPRFAEAVSGVVLPGFTAFNYGDLLHAFKDMQNKGLSVRFKDPSNTAGLGQFPIQNIEELDQVMTNYGNKIGEVGAVLEANLNEPTTVTVGYVNLNGETYAWYGKPYNVNHNGLVRFGGNEITVVRGGFKSLHSHCESSSELLAIYQAEQVFNAYTMLGTTATRAVFDAVQGIADNGTFISGITDPSLRPSASSAAEIRAVEEFVAHPELQVVRTRVLFDYARSHEKRASQELFVAHRRVDMFVELVDVV